MHGRKKHCKGNEIINDKVKQRNSNKYVQYLHCNNIKDVEFLKNQIMEKYNPVMWSSMIWEQSPPMGQVEWWFLSNYIENNLPFEQST